MRPMNAMEADRYGFRWGQVDVTRMGVARGYRFVTVETDHERVSIIVSPKGRKIRVFRGPVELTDQGQDSPDGAA